MPVTSLKRSALLQTPSTNIIDALGKIPGVSQLSTGPAISKPIIRGLGYNRVVTINEGARQEGQQWGDEHGIEIDELSIARAEVLKGPASLMYGSDAMAGVVNLITNVPVAEGTLKGNILGWILGIGFVILIFALFGPWGFLAIIGGIVIGVLGSEYLEKMFVRQKQIYTRKEGARKNEAVQDLVLGGWSFHQPMA